MARTPPDVGGAMGQAAAQAAALGHRLGRFTIEVAGRGQQGHHDLGRGVPLPRRRRGVRQADRAPGHRPRSVTIHGPAVEESHRGRTPRPAGDAPLEASGAPPSP